MKYWRHTTQNVGFSIFLVSAFPFLMLGWGAAERKLDLVDALCWLAFVVGLIEKALLIELGPRCWHGNFGWGYSLGVFCIWLSAVSKLLAFVTMGRWRLWHALPLAMLLAHLVSGIVYVYRLLALNQWM